MSDATYIEWTDATWNPVTGCTKVSAGCDHCYIARTPPFRMTGRAFHCRRCSGAGRIDSADGTAYAAVCPSCDGDGIGSAPTTGVWLHYDRLDWPLRKRSWRGKRVFVCSLADLFQKAVHDDFIARVFAVMALTPDVTYQVLTKRPARMRALLSGRNALGESFADVVASSLPHPHAWPLPNVWLGVSVEDQRAAGTRIPILLDTPAAVRWVSCEPLLGPVGLPVCRCLGAGSIAHGRHWPDTVCDQCGGSGSQIDWVVVGGESGPGARPMHPDWARSLRDQCAIAGVPYLFKQWGEWAPDERIDEDGVRHVGRKPEVRDPKSLVMHPAGMTALRPDNPFDPWERGHPCWNTVMRRVGRKRAGRLLDGVQHDGYPGGES